MLCVGVVDWSRKELESFRVVEKLEIEPKKFIQLRCVGATRVGGQVPLERVGGCHSGECVYPTRTSGQIDLARSVVYPPLGVRCTLRSGCSGTTRSILTSRIVRY